MTAGPPPFPPRPRTDQDAFAAALRAAIGGRSGDSAPALAADIGAAMAVLAAARLDLDRIEARWLEITQEGTARAAVARVLALTRDALDEYVRRLRSHHNGPGAAAES